MILKLILEEDVFELNVPEDFIEQAKDFFDKMDADMDQGWQMSRDWIPHPDKIQRCKIAADKLVTALEKENHDLGRLMAGYILSRLPDVDSVEPDITGEIINTRFFYKDGTSASDQPPEPGISVGINPALMAQAEREVSQIVKVGRQWRFSLYNPQTDSWEQSPAIASEEEAGKMRKFAVDKRYAQLAKN